MSLVYSFTEWNGFTTPEFIGIKNYIELFTSKSINIGRALKNAMLLAVLSCCLQLPFALWLALRLARPIKGRTALLSIFFMPVILGAAVVATMWKLIFSTPTGPVYLFMKDILKIENPPAILSSYSYAFPAVIAAQIWQHMGYSMVIFLASLQSIPEDLYEASRIDGASEFQIFWRITIPLVWSAITVNTLLAIIGSLQSYELIMTITRGGFNTATLGMMVFATAFGGGGATASGGSVAGMRQGYAAAESMVLFVGVLVVTIISQTIMNKLEAER